LIFGGTKKYFSRIFENAVEKHYPRLYFMNILINLKIAPFLKHKSKPGSFLLLWNIVYSDCQTNPNQFVIFEGKITASIPKIFSNLPKFKTDGLQNCPKSYSGCL